MCQDNCLSLSKFGEGDCSNFSEKLREAIMWMIDVRKEQPLRLFASGRKARKILLQNL